MKTLKVTITGEIALMETENEEDAKRYVEDNAVEKLGELGLLELHIQWEEART